MYCDQGENVIHEPNQWKKGTAFTLNFTLPKSFKGKFFGGSVRYYYHSLGPWIQSQIHYFYYLEKSLNFTTDVFLRSPSAMPHLITTKSIELGGCAHTRHTVVINMLIFHTSM